MAQLYKDPYFDIWHGSKEGAPPGDGVVVKKLGRRVFTVTTLTGAGQFDSRAKAFKAAQRYLDNGISPYDDPNNLARLWTHED